MMVPYVLPLSRELHSKISLDKVPQAASQVSDASHCVFVRKCGLGSTKVLKPLMQPLNGLLDPL